MQPSFDFPFKNCARFSKCFLLFAVHIEFYRSVRVHKHAQPVYLHLIRINTSPMTANLAYGTCTCLIIFYSLDLKRPESRLLLKLKERASLSVSVAVSVCSVESSNWLRLVAAAEEFQSFHVSNYSFERMKCVILDYYTFTTFVRAFVKRASSWWTAKRI